MIKKTILILCLGLIINNSLYSQTTISGNGAVGHSPGAGSNSNTHYLGWLNNRIPLWFNTNGVVRARLNNSAIVNINSVNQNVTGYFGIGLNNYFATETPMAMLHLEGPNNSGNMTGFGWRAWMRKGTFAEIIVFFIV